MSALPSCTIVRKRGCKPFPNGKRLATISGTTDHPYLPGAVAYTFIGFDEVVSVDNCIEHELIRQVWIIEGYDGLVVHGPLLAQYLMLLAQENLGPLKAFSFRATAPLMHFETATLCWKDRDLWVRAPDGRQCMKATASPI